MSWMCTLYGIRQQDFLQVLQDLGITAPQMRVNRLSQGFQVRLQMALLSLVRSHVWYLDEPWVHLDQHTGSLLSQWVNSHIGEGGAVVVSSHQMPAELNNARECLL